MIAPMIQKELTLQSTAIQCTIQFEDRHSFMMRYRNFILEIKAPFYASLSDIDRWINAKETWILKQHRLQTRLKTNDDELWFLNRKVPIFYQSASSLRVQAFPGGISIDLPPTLTKQEALQKAEIHLAQDVILPIMRKAMKDTQLIPKMITLKTMKRSWGRCSSTGHITLNKKLIACDPRFIEYVCVHELCHLVHMDHSHRFYAKIASFLPDYKQRKKLSPYHLALG